MAVLRPGRFRAGPAGTGKNAHQSGRPGRRGRGCLSRAHRDATYSPAQGIGTGYAQVVDA